MVRANMAGIFIYMKLCVLLLCFRCSLATADATNTEFQTDWSEILVWLEKSNLVIDKTIKGVEWANDFVEGSDVNIVKTLSRTISAVSTLVKGLGFWGSVVNFLFFLSALSSFGLGAPSGPSELQQVMDELTELNRQMDVLNAELKEQTIEIKSSVTFNAWLTTYFPFELQIRNCDEKLKSVIADIMESTSKEEQLKLSSEFVAYFDEHNTEDAIRNIHRLTGQTSTVTSENLFELFIQEKGYHPRELAKLMVVIVELFTSASRQALTYHAFKGGMKQMERSYNEILLLLDDIRIQFELNIWYIRRDIKEHVYAEAMTFVDDHPEMDATDEMADGIQKHLTSMYGWFEWAVVVDEDIPLITKGEFESIGLDYFFISKHGDDKKKDIY